VIGCGMLQPLPRYTVPHNPRPNSSWADEGRFMDMR
jgi:hypothetical protein